MRCHEIVMTITTESHSEVCGIPEPVCESGENLTSQSRVSVGEDPVMTCPMHIAGIARRSAAAMAVKLFISDASLDKTAERCNWISVKDRWNGHAGSVKT